MTDNSWMLRGVTSVPGVRHALVLTSDGLPHSFSEDLSQDAADTLAAACSGLYALASSIAAEHGDDRMVRQQMVEFSGGFLFLRAAGAGGRLAVLAGPSIDPGVVAQQMAILVNQIGEHTLSAPARGGTPT